MAKPFGSDLFHGPLFIFMRLLHANGMSRTEFDNLLELCNWSEVESIAGVIQDGQVKILLDDETEASANFLVYESGGCSSYLKIRRRLVTSGTWKWMFLPEEVKIKARN